MQKKPSRTQILKWLSQTQQRELYEILFHTEPLWRDQAIDQYLAKNNLLAQMPISRGDLQSGK